MKNTSIKWRRFRANIKGENLNIKIGFSQTNFKIPKVLKLR